jgi:hypothetical protein
MYISYKWLCTYSAKSNIKQHKDYFLKVARNPHI